MTPLWRLKQRENFTKLEPLADFLSLSPELRSHLLARPRFPLNLPRRLAEKIAKNTLDDPILRQFLPLKDELISAPGYTTEPLEDSRFRLSKKLLQKYQGRALLVTTSACAMNCRFCFRQNFPYETEAPDYQEELALIAQDPSLTEIILSGGDPLSLSDERLGSLLNSLNAIPHIKRIRFHTRFPIGIPERIDASFLSLFPPLQKQVVFVIHCNHPKELDPTILQALKRLQTLGIPLLNQSVLLRQVNDSVPTLVELSETLANAGILPYYLHLHDPVLGTAHFDVSLQEGEELIAQMRKVLSGYAVPRLVREEPGNTNKTVYL
jgi:EF-P beta-lysylation protein EpmB